MTLSALTLGLVVSVFRWVLFESVLCHGYQLTPEDFEGLVAEFFNEQKFEAYRALGAHTAQRAVEFWDRPMPPLHQDPSQVLCCPPEANAGRKGLTRRWFRWLAPRV